MGADQQRPQKSSHLTKVPPQNVEAEMAFLGAILIDHDAINKILDVVTPEDFYREANRRVFETMIQLYNKNEPMDFLTVSNYLEGQGHLEFVGGSSYLSGLADSIPSSANIVSYGKIIREKAILRQLITTATMIEEQSYDGGEDVDKILDQAEKMIFDISEGKSRLSFSKVKDVVKDSFKRIEQLFENKKHITGLATGFADFDHITCGLQPSDLVILAARPSMGKTALALNIAENAAIKERANVAIFSLEMAKEQLVMRMLCSQARIDSSKLRKGQLEEQDWPMLTKAAGNLSDINLYIDDSPAPNILEMRAKARRLKKDSGLDLLIVDYLQLVRPAVRSYSREQEISEISRGLKALAKELHIPILALSQLNRAVENRVNKRPMLADLRESGAIEQDADVICFIYRDEVYDPGSPDKGVAEIIVGKQRNGPIGVCRLAFLNSYTKFENLAFEPHEVFSASEESLTPF